MKLIRIKRHLILILLLLPITAPKPAGAKDSRSQRATNLVRQAVAAYNAHDYSHAVALCETAVSIDPRFARAYTWLGAAYLQHGAHIGLALQMPHGSARGMPGGQQCENGVAADEPGAARHQNCAHRSHSCSPRGRVAAVVRRALYAPRAATGAMQEPRPPHSPSNYLN